MPALAPTEPGERARRVLHVLPDLAIGGGQTVVLSGARHVDRDRFDVQVSHLLANAELSPAFAACEVPVIDLAHRDGTGLRTAFRLVRRIRTDDIDLLHVHSDMDRRYALPAALVTGTPVVAHLHSEWDHLAPKLPPAPSRARSVRSHVAAAERRRMERTVVRHYIAASTRVRDLFAPLVGDTPITVVTPGIPDERFRAALGSDARSRLRAELGILPAAPVLVTVSRLVAAKGHEQLLRIFCEIHGQIPEAVLVVVGDGVLGPSLQDLAAELGLAGAVRFPGSRQDVPELLVAGDLFVFASESEGFGMAVLEAMAAARAVVAFRLPALEEFAEPAAAELVPTGDAQAFVQAVVALLQDPERAAAMGDAGRRVVQRRFDDAAVSRSFESVYDAVLGGGR